MAKRRCISRDVFESDAYHYLSHPAKTLYTAFILYSDDEGVVINTRTAMRMCECHESDLIELVDSGFLLNVGDIYVIKHWYVHNKVQPSRMTKSLYQDELARLYVTQTKEYELRE